MQVVVKHKQVKLFGKYIFDKLEEMFDSFYFMEKFDCLTKHKETFDKLLEEQGNIQYLSIEQMYDVLKEMEIEMEVDEDLYFEILAFLALAKTLSEHYYLDDEY